MKRAVVEGRRNPIQAFYGKKGMAGRSQAGSILQYTLQPPLVFDGPTFFSCIDEYIVQRVIAKQTQEQRDKEALQEVRNHQLEARLVFTRDPALGCCLAFLRPKTDFPLRISPDDSIQVYFEQDVGPEWSGKVIPPVTRYSLGTDITAIIFAPTRTRVNQETKRSERYIHPDRPSYWFDASEINDQAIPRFKKFLHSGKYQTVTLSVQTSNKTAKLEHAAFAILNPNDKAKNTDKVIAHKFIEHRTGLDMKKSCQPTNWYRKCKPNARTMSQILASSDLQVLERGLGQIYGVRNFRLTEEQKMTL